MSVRIALVGPGLVGSEVLSQLAVLTSYFTVVSISNSRKTLLSHDGILPTPDPLERFKSEAKPSTLESLVSTLKECASNQWKGFRTVLVDCTASPAVADLYPSVISGGISIVTPNKIGLSSSEKLYSSIKSALLSSTVTPPVKLLHEATVGAGLPIISTLSDLIATGDEVYKVEGVLSGTLSYIFNNFSPAFPSTSPEAFSAIVAKAKQLGYTEPNPHSDLSGADVARKLTILSRLLPKTPIPLPEGYMSVPTGSLSPAGLENITDGDEYVKELAKCDSQFEQLRADASVRGEVLRFVAVLDVQKGVVKASLESYPATHPFATSLSGSDNIIAFHTKRYGPRPLIVQGAGAGAAVTAMGVVSDLLKLV